MNFSWIFFRANNFNEAIFIINKIFTRPGYIYFGFGEDITAFFYAIIAIGLLIVIEFKKEFFNTLFSISNSKYGIIRLFGYAIVVFIIFYLGVFGENQFIYFQF